MNRCVLFLNLAVLSACASSAPSVPVTPAPEPIVDVSLPPPPPPARVEVAPPVQTPAVPLPSPRLRISQRSVYEEDRVVRWRLENGLTIWYAWDPEAEGYAALVNGLAPSSAPALGFIQPSGTVAIATSDRFDQAASSARLALVASGGSLSDHVVAFHGSASPEWLEAAVAETFGTLSARSTPAAPRPSGGQAATEVEWGDFPALSIAAALIADRGSPTDRATIQYDASNGTATLHVRTGTGVLKRFLEPGTEEAIRNARSRAARLAESGSGLVTSMGLLERLPGRYQPARPPSEIRDLSGLIERTPPSRVNTLLARLSAALPTAE